MNRKDHWEQVYQTKAPDDVSWFQNRPTTSLARYDAPSICTEIGVDFQFVEQMEETHTTPWDTTQKFSYFRFQRRERAA